MIKVVLDINLIYPYNVSLHTLTEFCYLWDTTILSGGTYKIKAVLSMPYKHFKSIFNRNPMVGACDVPSILSKVVESVYVKEIKIK